MNLLLLLPLVSRLLHLVKKAAYPVLYTFTCHNGEMIVSVGQSVHGSPTEALAFVVVRCGHYRVGEGTGVKPRGNHRVECDQWTSGCIKTSKVMLVWE